MPRKAKQEPERRVTEDFSRAIPMDEETKTKIGEMLIKHIFSNLNKK